MAKTKDLTNGSPIKLILTFALPLMAGNIFQQLYIIVDSVIVGQTLGVSALASLGVADWLNWLVMGIVIGCADGFSILLARRFGAGDSEGVRRGFAMMILLNGSIALCLMVICLIGLPTILTIMHTDREIMGGTLTYLRVFFSGIPVIAAYNTMAATLRALGNSRTPLFAMMTACAVNILLDLLFVRCFGWGIFGAAIATVIAQVCSCLFCLRVILSLNALHLGRADFHPHRPTIRALLRLGPPVALQNAIIGVGGILLQSIVNQNGVLFVAGFTATNKLYGLLELAAIAFGFSMASFNGQNMGAGNFDRIRKGIRCAAGLGVVTAMVISLCMLVFGRPLLSMFLSGPPDDVSASLSIAYNYLSLMACFLPILYMLHIYRSGLQGLGNTVVPMLSGCVELLMRVAIVFVAPAILGPFGIFWAEIGAWTGAALLLIPSFYLQLSALKNRP